MTKDMLELKRAISTGIAEGIVTGIKKVEGHKPEPSILDCAKAIKDYCNKQGTCATCMLVDEDNALPCTIAYPPHMWDLNNIK